MLMKIIFSNSALLSWDLPGKGPMIVPNALINATQRGVRAVNQWSANASTVSLCNANFRQSG